MVRSPRVLIVADDLTGAMDSAGPFAALGIETWVVAVPMRCDPASLKSARCVSVNTDTRHLPAALAAARVRDIMRHLGTGGVGSVGPKKKSTNTGNAAAGTRAAARISARRRPVLAPAAAGAGRAVRG